MWKFFTTLSLVACTYLALYGAYAQERGGLRAPAPVIPPEDPGLRLPVPKGQAKKVEPSAGPEIIIVTKVPDDGGPGKVERADLKQKKDEEMPPPPTPPRPTLPVPPPVRDNTALPPLPMPERTPPSTKQEPELPLPLSPAVPAPPPATNEPAKILIKEVPPKDAPKTPKAPAPTIRMPSPEPAQATATEPGPSKPRSFVLVRQKPGVQAPAPSRPDIAPPVPPRPEAAVRPTPPPVTETSVSKSVSTLDPAPPAGVQTPQVTVEKRGPTIWRAGDTLAYQLVIRNAGPGAAQFVRIDDELPPGTRAIAAEPTPALEGARAVWMLTGVAAGAERVLSITLQAAAAGGGQARTTVSVSSSSASEVSAAPAAPGGPAAPAEPLVARVTAPASVALGAPAVFEVTLTNQTRLAQNGLLLQAMMSVGLRHAMGQNIEAEVGGLEPGATRTIKLATTAVQPGRQQLTVRLTTLAGASATAGATVDVGAAPSGLTVHQPAPPRAFVGRDAELRIVVTNPSPLPLRDIIVVNTLPEGVEYAGASDRGLHQPVNRTVHWLLEQLGPGQTQVLLVRVQGKKAGRYENEVVARAGGMPEVTSKAPLSVEGATDLSVRLTGEDALEQGREGVYEVHVANPGTAPATGVVVQVAFTEGLLPRSAQGPGRFRIDGQTVTFETLPSLNAQGQAVYRVLAAGTAAGDRRARATVTSQQVQTPVQREKRTQVYRD